MSLHLCVTHVCSMFLSPKPMPPIRKTPLTPSKHGRILQLRKLGWDYHRIAKEIGCAPSTALYTQRQEEKYHTHNDLPRSGCPRAIDNRTECHIIREIKNNRFKPYKYILGVTYSRSNRAPSPWHRQCYRLSPLCRASQALSFSGSSQEASPMG